MIFKVMPKYTLKFLPKALKEWNKLDTTLRQQFRKKLAERLEHPHAPSSRLSGFQNIYKIKLRSASYRLVYQVNDKEIFVLVIITAKRDKDLVYKKMKDRLE
jgi:mRNA interferase RelE/StbE